jgi:hypothetical protein
MDTTSVAYVLCRFEDDSSLTPVGSFASIAEATCEAGNIIEPVDHDFAYELRTSNGRVATIQSRRGVIG